MHKEIRVVLVEDDPYSRDLMAMLLSRDWRTRVIAELGSSMDVDHYLSQDQIKADIVILDTEIPGDSAWHFRITDAFQAIPNPPTVLCTGTQVDLETLKTFAKGGLGGYLLKNEILYSLAAAISLTFAGDKVVTPGIWQAAQDHAILLPKRFTVIDGAKPVANFTSREKEIVRLGILFNLAHRDVADELIISPIWVSELVSKIYEKLGMHAIISGDYPIKDYFEDAFVAEKIEKILARSNAKNNSKKLRRTPWVSTLAFHMLTVPEKEYVHTK